MKDQLIVVAIIFSCKSQNLFSLLEYKLMYFNYIGSTVEENESAFHVTHFIRIIIQHEVMEPTGDQKYAIGPSHSNIAEAL